MHQPVHRSPCSFPAGLEDVAACHSPSSKGGVFRLFRGATALPYWTAPLALLRSLHRPLLQPPMCQARCFVIPFSGSTPRLKPDQLGRVGISPHLGQAPSPRPWVGTGQPSPLLSPDWWEHPTNRPEPF